MRYPLRFLAGVLALAIGVWLASSPATADVPDLPVNSYKKAADADVKFLQTRMGELKGKPKDAWMKPAIGAALSLSVYADALGDPALRTDALKFLEEMQKEMKKKEKERDFKVLSELANKLTVKQGNAPTKSGLPKVGDNDQMLEYAMQPFRPRTSGGMGLERDLDEYTRKDKPRAIDLANIELLAVRTAVSLELALHYPNKQARTTPKDTKQWEKLSTDSIEDCNKILAETAKGKTADERTLRTLLGNLSAKCMDCHKDYRDEDR